MKNIEIYNYAQALLTAFQEKDQKLPMKINFYLQKNKNTLIDLAQEIEKSRLEIASSNGTLNEETNQYEIPPESMDKVSKEIQDLFDLEQEVKIYKVKADDLTNDLSLTTSQMEAIMFMIEE